MSPLAYFYYDWVDTITPGENNKKNNKLTRIRDLASNKKKNTKFHLFEDRNLKILQ